jgi:hypothetical protein
MIDGLRSLCEVELCSHINRDTVCSLFHLSEMYKSLYMKEGKKKKKKKSRSSKLTAPRSYLFFFCISCM